MILDEQHIAAREYYERQLNNAHYDLQRARRNYDDALRDGADEFRRSLHRARQQKRSYSDSYNRYVQEGLSVEADQAMQQMEYYENRITYLMLNRDTIIYDSADYERRKMNTADDDYHRILHSQQRIINDYVAPYKRKVEKAREHLDMTNNFHRTVFGGY